MTLLSFLGGGVFLFGFFFAPASAPRIYANKGMVPTKNRRSASIRKTALVKYVLPLFALLLFDQAHAIALTPTSANTALLITSEGTLHEAQTGDPLLLDAPVGLRYENSPRSLPLLRIANDENGRFSGDGQLLTPSGAGGVFWGRGR